MIERTLPGAEKGPDLVIEYKSMKSPAGPVIVRSTLGKLMNRHDVLTASGWHDWKVDDIPQRKSWVLKDSQGKTVLAPVGTSKWKGHGPTIPASNNCLSCHDVASVSTTVAIEPRFGPVERFLAPRLKPEATEKQGAMNSPESLPFVPKPDIVRDWKLAERAKMLLSPNDLVGKGLAGAVIFLVKR